jgi:hypothetical protein
MLAAAATTCRQQRQLESSDAPSFSSAVLIQFNGREEVFKHSSLYCEQPISSRQVRLLWMLRTETVRSLSLKRSKVDAK